MPELAPLPDVPELDSAAARDWIERWDRQQEVYLADREDRFTALIDAVEAGAGRPDPVVLDLGCGPGSLSVRLLRRLPAATVVAVDADPVTLALGRAAYSDVPGLRFLDADLRVRGWENELGLPPGARVDAAVSTTALHWLPAAELRDLYATLAGLVRPGGLFLDGDHLRVSAADSPVLARLERELEERGTRRHMPGGPGPGGPGGPGSDPDGHDGRAENWEQWWDAVRAHPVLAAAAAERERRQVGHHGPESVQFALHATALRAAGFAEVGTLWQRGGDRLLCAVR